MPAMRKGAKPRSVALRGLVCWLGACGSGLAGGCVQFEHESEGGAVADGDDGGAEQGPGESSGGTPTSGGGGEAECGLWKQDCPAGSKCAPFDSDADNIHDTARCVPVGGTPGQPGDDCTVEGSVASGVDSCDLGLLCWNTDAQNQGRCVTMCSGTPADPQCPSGLICDVSNGGALPLCVASCDPLAPSCPMGQICLPGGPSQDYFVCDVDASGDMGGYGDACAYVNVCDAGLLCLGSASVPGCKSEGCCSEYCDLSSADAQCSGAGQVCLSFYGGDAPPPGYENVGVCSLPL